MRWNWQRHLSYERWILSADNCAERTVITPPFVLLLLDFWQVDSAKPVASSRLYSEISLHSPWISGEMFAKKRWVSCGRQTMSWPLDREWSDRTLGSLIDRPPSINSEGPWPVPSTGLSLPSRRHFSVWRRRRPSSVWTRWWSYPSGWPNWPWLNSIQILTTDRAHRRWQDRYQIFNDFDDWNLVGNIADNLHLEWLDNERRKN